MLHGKTAKRHPIPAAVLSDIQCSQPNQILECFTIPRHEVLTRPRTRFVVVERVRYNAWIIQPSHSAQHKHPMCMHFCNARLEGCEARLMPETNFLMVWLDETLDGREHDRQNNGSEEEKSCAPHTNKHVHARARRMMPT